MLVRAYAVLCHYIDPAHRYCCNLAFWWKLSTQPWLFMLKLGSLSYHSVSKDSKSSVPRCNQEPKIKRNVYSQHWSSCSSRIRTTSTKKSCMILKWWKKRGLRVRIHYTGYGSEYDEWWPKSEVILNKPGFLPSSSLTLRWQLACSIKKSLKPSRSEEPEVRIQGPLWPWHLQIATTQGNPCWTQKGWFHWWYVKQGAVYDHTLQWPRRAPGREATF